MSKKLLIGIAIILVSGSVIAIYGASRQKKQVVAQNPTNQQIEQKNQNDVALQNQPSNLNGNDINNAVYYKIPELGIQFKTTSEIANNLEYAYSENSIDRTNKKFQMVRIMCSTLRKYGKSDVNLSEPPYEGRPYKDMGDFYIVYWGQEDTSCLGSEIKIDWVDVVKNLEPITNK